MNNDSYNNNKKPAIIFMQRAWLNANCWIRTDREWYIDMNLRMLGKLQCGIMTPNTKLTHGTKTENKGGKTRC